MEVHMVELVVGKGLPRIDSLHKATGATKYVADMKFPGMLCGKIVRSPYAHARILRVDLSRAKKLAGVRAALSASDLPAIKYGIIIEDEEAFARHKTRFIGDEVAAVAAEDEETAQEAASLVKVEYGPLPAVFDPMEAMAQGAPLIHEAERNLAAHAIITRGDVEDGFSRSEEIFEDIYTTQTVHHAYIEPVACAALYKAPGKFTIYGPFQSPFLARSFLLAKPLGVAEESVRVVQTPVGGGFGGKLDQKLYLIAALLAMKSERPVRIVNTWEEEFNAARPRVPVRIELKLGFKRDGLIMAKKTRVVANNGAYSSIAPAVATSIAIRTDSLYRIKNLMAEICLVYTNTTPTGQFRGLGNPQGTFAMDSLMERAAHSLGIDPVEIRLKNAAQAGDITAHGWRIRSCGLSDCLKSASKALEWGEKKAKAPDHKGLGMACTIHVSSNRAFRNYDASEARIVAGKDGRFRVITGEADIGQGSNTIFAQIAAQELGVELSRVDVPDVDTDEAAYCLGTYASRVTIVGGNAVRDAAIKARAKLFELASKKLEVDPDDLTASGGRVFVKGSPGKGIAYSELLEEELRETEAINLARGSFDPDSVMADPKTKYGNVAASYSFGAQAAEVEVDLETGRVKVLRVAAAHDLGRAINPMLAAGQIEGGVVQGVGYAIMEEVLLQEGRCANPSFADYRIPTALDAPKIVPILVEPIDPVGPYGAKGVAETTLNPTAGAIANAIYNATGVALRGLPFTPENVFKALKNALSQR